MFRNGFGILTDPDDGIVAADADSHKTEGAPKSKRPLEIISLAFDYWMANTACTFSVSSSSPPMIGVKELAADSANAMRGAAKS